MSDLKLILLLVGGLFLFGGVMGTFFPEALVVLHSASDMTSDVGRPAMMHSRVSSSESLVYGVLAMGLGLAFLIGALVMKPVRNLTGDSDEAAE